MSIHNKRGRRDWAQIKGEYRASKQSTAPFKISLSSDCDKNFFQSRLLLGSGHFEFVVPPGSYRISGATIETNDSNPSRQLEYRCSQIILASDRAVFPIVVEPSEKQFDTIEQGADSLDEPVEATSSAQNDTALVILDSLSKGPFGRKQILLDYKSPEIARLEDRHCIYALSEFSADRLPIVFVHGLLDSPRSFSGIIAKLDLARYQPCFYSYPSGMSLKVAGDFLVSQLGLLALRYGFSRIDICAHSMGGLLSRHALNQLSRTTYSPFKVSRFVSVSTPWLGHEAARIGRIFYPPMRASWIDVAQGSDFIQSLFNSKLPSGCEHHLYFSHRRSSRSWLKMSGLPKVLNHDGFVSLKSQLMPKAQDQATRIYGIDAEHRKILYNSDFITRLAGSFSGAENSSSHVAQV
jgi:pimeloyl-ACP methyl ester carboxylesterase